MRFDKQKKESIKAYIISKISEDIDNIPKYVSNALEINKSTVYRYINEMVDEGLIAKIPEGSFAVISNDNIIMLSRSKNELTDESEITGKYISQYYHDFSDNIVHIWEYTLSEMINNVIDHSGAEHLKITVRRDPVNTTVTLEDDGVGIFRKISGFLGCSEEDAIVELMKGKLTTDSVNHSGEGIFFTARMLDEFYIISGGRVFSCNEFDTDEVLFMNGESPVGTKMVMKLSNNSPKQISCVFDEYASVDGGFFKTSLPLGNIYPNGPVSRSQAKRLCHRLEEFSDVILDFAGVAWMGQGFAHQLFRVYTATHSEVRLEPVNMCDSVRKMYEHVMAVG
ncbi:MAG: DUF4325 domain-containing protein [Lachnospiraceae bacterium]|nr:DUF4325 domain-containing protein [Lachnospiraceae bacterium]